MTKKILSGSVPELRLTPQEEVELRHLATQLERESISQYEDFLLCDQRCVDPSKWKLVKSDGDVSAYKERHVRQRLRPDIVNATLHPGPQQKLVQQSLLPRVRVTGTVPGLLDDAMYGITFQDTLTLQNFWAAQGDRMEESAIVAKLDGAAVDDPYRFLGVKWFVRTFPLNLLQRRDFLALWVSGMTQLSNGERVGVAMAYSIEHCDIPEYHAHYTIRGDTAFHLIARQLDAGNVEIFMTHFLDTKGMIPEAHHVQVSVSHLIPMGVTVCDAGLRKKLEWLVACRKREDRAATSVVDVIEPQSSGTNDMCELCDKKLGTLFSSSGTACLLCYRRVCSRCSVSHELGVPATATRTVLRGFDFCAQCSLEVRAMSTLTVAQQEALYRRSMTSSNSSSSKSRERTQTTLMSPEALSLVEGSTPECE